MKGEGWEGKMLGGKMDWDAGWQMPSICTFTKSDNPLPVCQNKSEYSNMFPFVNNGTVIIESFKIPNVEWESSEWGNKVVHILSVRNHMWRHFEDPKFLVAPKKQSVFCIISYKPSLSAAAELAPLPSSLSFSTLNNKHQSKWNTIPSSEASSSTAHRRLRLFNEGEARWHKLAKNSK